MRPWPRHPLVLEVNTRVWVRERCAAAGLPPSMDAVPAASLEAMARAGFDAVWLMGVWTTGEAARAEARRQPGLWDEYRRALPDVREADVVGSPYAVSRYEVAPALGGPAALASLRERMRGLGLKVLLDFVPNHTACDHGLVDERPEAFVRGTEDDLARAPDAFFRSRSGAVVAHGRDPYFPPWTDTAQVDHASAAGREAMTDELLAVASQCDGVRCDMAMLPLPDVFARTWGRGADMGARGGFWGEAVPAVRARHPSFLLVAEAYWGLETRLQALGFDFTYDKELYDRLRDSDPGGVRRHLAREAAFQARCARFLENHDEPRASAVFGERLQAAAAVAFLGPGLRLFHEGQLEGRRQRVPVQLARRPQEPVDPAARQLYDGLFGLLRRDTLRNGFWQPLTPIPAGPGDQSHESLVASLWRATAEAPPEFLVVAHLGGGEAYARLPLDVPGLEPRVLLDHLDAGRRYVRDAAEMREPGLFVGLGPHRAHAFEIRQPA